MLNVGPTLRVFIAPDPIDLHFSFDRLAGIVRNRLGQDPTSGHLFAFFNRQRTRTKMLLFDRTGYVVYYKRLERGTFEIPRVLPGARQVEVDPAVLAMILEGIDLRAPRRLRYSIDDRKKAFNQS